MKSIGNISGHCGGGVFVREQDGEYFWGIEGYRGVEDWQEIPKGLYDALVEFEKEEYKKWRQTQRCGK